MQELVWRRGAQRETGGQLPLLRDDGVSGPHHLRRHAVFRGLRRDFQEAGHGHRAGPRRLRIGRQSDRRRSHGVQHQDAHRHVLQRAGHGDPRRPGREHRPQHVRRQGARRLLLGRNADQARAQEIQDRERRLHHLRPADTPLGGRLRVGDDQPRRLRVPDQLRLPGQGCAVDVPAHLLLPDPGGRPRDGIPDSDLRLVDPQGPDAQQRVLLGHRPQPRRDGLSRLDVQGRPAVGRRIPLRARPRLTGRQPVLLARRERGHRQFRQRRPRHAQLYRQRQHDAAPAPCVLASRQRRLFLEHRHAADLSAGHRPRHQSQSPLRLVRDRGDRQLSGQRHGRSDRLFLYGDVAHDLREHAARQHQQGGAANRRFAGLPRRPGGIRHAAPQLERRRRDHAGSGADPVRRGAHRPRAIQPLAVPRHQFRGHLAGDVLDRTAADASAHRESGCRWTREWGASTSISRSGRPDRSSTASSIRRRGKKERSTSTSSSRRSRCRR